MINRLIENIHELGQQPKVDPTIQMNGIIANTIHLLDSLGADTSKIKAKLQEIQQQPPEE